MPQRTNDFQKLIRMLTQLLGDGAVVEESKMLTDLVSGDKCEVDIYAEGTLAGHTVNIGIECRDHARKQGKAWVDEMRSKHDRLPTNLLILVSSSGFSQSAIDKANSYGIKTITPNKVDSDLASEVLATFGVTMMPMWFFTDVTTNLRGTVPTEWLSRNEHPVVPGDGGKIQYYRQDGSPLVGYDQFNMTALSEYLAARHPELMVSGTDSELYIDLPMDNPAFQGEPLYALWTADGEQPTLVPVAVVAIKGKAKTVSQLVTVSPTGEIVYDGNSYLTGSAPTAQGQAQIVVSDAQGQRRTKADFPVYIPPPAGENRAARRRRQRGG